MRNELSVRYDARQSFYGKAQVESKNGVTKLYSYNVLVAKINKKNNLVLFPSWDYSSTTLRHVKEFIKQYTTYSFGNMSKSDIEKAIKEKMIKIEH